MYRDVSTVDGCDSSGKTYSAITLSYAPSELQTQPVESLLMSNGGKCLTTVQKGVPNLSCSFLTSSSGFLDYSASILNDFTTLDSDPKTMNVNFQSDSDNNVNCLCFLDWRAKLQSYDPAWATCSRNYLPVTPHEKVPMFLEAKPALAAPTPPTEIHDPNQEQGLPATPASSLRAPVASQTSSLGSASSSLAPSSVPENTDFSASGQGSSSGSPASMSHQQASGSDQNDPTVGQAINNAFQQGADGQSSSDQPSSGPPTNTGPANAGETQDAPSNNPPSKGPATQDVNKNAAPPNISPANDALVDAEQLQNTPSNDALSKDQTSADISASPAPASDSPIQAPAEIAPAFAGVLSASSTLQAASHDDLAPTEPAAVNSAPYTTPHISSSSDPPVSSAYPADVSSPTNAPSPATNSNPSPPLQVPQPSYPGIDVSVFSNSEPINSVIASHDVIIASSTVPLDAPVITIANQQISLELQTSASAPAAVVVNGQTHDLPSLYPQTLTLSTITALSGHTIVASQDGIAVDGTTIALGSSVVPTVGTSVQLNASTTSLEGSSAAILPPAVTANGLESSASSQSEAMTKPTTGAGTTINTSAKSQQAGSLEGAAGRRVCNLNLLAMAMLVWMVP